MPVYSRLATSLFALFLTATVVIAESVPFELQDGDRVVLLGDGLIEQEQYHGWLELMLTTAYPDRNVTFRNLGWSADTPSGISRYGLSLLQAGNAPRDEAWKQLQNQLTQANPDVVILGYGMASSLELGEQDIQAFLKEYEQLLSFLRNRNSKIRLVFLSPLTRVRIEKQSLPGGHGDHTMAIKQYRDAIANLAKRSQSPFVDLTDVALDHEQRKDAIHLNDAGYKALAITVGTALEIEQANWQESPHANELLDTILKKNEWFFHRSRPANMAYVFGFRKREQGQNAVEIPQFDALISAEEKHIAALRSLEPVQIKRDPPRTKSAFAKFTPQPLPEFTTGEGLEVSLWAENPMLNKPIQMNFDASGRLWVASSEAYPMIEVGQTANDRIIILEDSNHDGKADKSSIFADGLLIPTGVLPTHDGAFVAQSTDLLHLQDTNGDGKADKKTRVLSGFGTEDTHHNLHTLRWGPDGRLYMNQSVYTRTDAETPRGITRLKAGGGFRFNPDSMRMQVFFAGLWNSWGHQFDTFGRSFMTDGAGFAGVAYVFPGAQFRPLPGGQRYLDLISPGNYPKFCSAELISGDSFPEDWQDTIITCDFRANRLTRFSLVESGAGYQTVQEADLLRTATASFRPIDVKQGPDGALYVADWSNPIINHGEVDFRDPRRDRWHGRIWRVAFKGQQPIAPTDFTQLSADKLLSHLVSSDRYARDKARRVLLSRPAETLAALASWTRQQTGGFAKLQSLWLYQAMHKKNLPLLTSLTADSSADIRSAAVRVLADWSDPDTDCQTPLTPTQAFELYKKLIHDSHPRVRLEAIAGLTALNSPEAARLALQSLDAPTDRFIEFALSELIGDVAEPLLSSLRQSPATDEQLEFVLGSIPPQMATTFLRDYLAKNKLPRDGNGPWIGLIGRTGGAQELDRLLSDIIQQRFSSPANVAALDALCEAHRLHKRKPTKGRHEIQRLFSHEQASVRKAAIRLAGAWQMKSSLKLISRIARDSEQDGDVRRTAIEAMRHLGAKDALQSLASNPIHAAVAAETLSALAKLDSEAAVRVFLALQPKMYKDVGIWRAVLSGKGNAAIIAEQLRNLQLDNDALRLGLRVAREGGRKAPALVQALDSKLGTVAVEPLNRAQIAALANEAARSGDPHRGELVYRNKDLACTTCHAIAGVGGEVGPDLSSIGASAPIDYLAESLYLPNAKIKENYHSVVVVTADGRQVIGIQSTESTADELVIRDAADKLVRIPRREIEDQVNGASLMPAGLIERLPKIEQLDLIRFLSMLGKPGDFDASNRGIARNFEILAGTHRVEQEGIAPILTGTTKGWDPITARISGKLPRAAIQDATKQPRNMSLVTVYLRTSLEANSDIVAQFEVAGDAKLWIDGQPVMLKNGKGKTMLTAERHQAILQLDARQLPSFVGLKGSNVSFTPTTLKNN